MYPWEHAVQAFQVSRELLDFPSQLVKLPAVAIEPFYVVMMNTLLGLQDTKEFWKRHEA